MRARLATRRAIRCSVRSPSACVERRTHAPTRLPRGAGSIIAQVRDFALDQPEVEYFTFSNVDYYKKGDPRASLSLA